MICIRKIVIPFGQRKKIAANLDVSVRSVTDALQFKHDTKLARYIRDVAIKSHGGRITQIKI